MQNRKPRVKPASKAAGVVKAQATRKANGTKGKTTHAMPSDDESDLPTFSEKLRASIMKVGRKKGTPESEIEDFAQKVWLEVRKSRALLPSKEPDRTKYIHGIARNLAKRTRKKAKKLGVELVSLDEIQCAAPVAHSSVAADLASKILAKASQRDPDATRWVVDHYVYDTKQTEIAAEEGVDIEVVRKRIQRVMAFMRNYGGTIAMVLMVLFCALAALLRRPKPDVAKPPQTDERQTKKQIADSFRRRAFSACDAKLYRECLDSLDLAREEDPEGDGAPDVVRARQDAERHLAPPAPPLQLGPPGDGKTSNDRQK